MERSFNLVCPFCEDIYPFPDDIEKIYGCHCGAVYKIALRHDMDDAVDQLAREYLKEGDIVRGKRENDILCHVVVYENIQNFLRMKMEYEAVKYIRPVQSFEQDCPNQLGLVWLGNYKGKGDRL